MSEPCHLMSLPPELREMIWAYALAEPEPITAFVEQRTVTRTPVEGSGPGSRFNSMRTQRMIRPQPALPPIAFVNAQLSKEALPIYYRENIFVFSLTGRTRDEVSRWIDLLQNFVMYLQIRWNALAAGPGVSVFDIPDALHEDTIPLWKYLTIRLEFLVRGPVRLQRDNSIKWLPTPAWVEINRVRDERKLAIRFGGQLEQECCCWMLDGIAQGLVNHDNENAYESGADTLLQHFALVVERLSRHAWQERERGTFEATRCEKCGKEDYATEERDAAVEEAVGDIQRELRLDVREA